MIPKKIHYCWFGRGTKSELIKRCIGTWLKFNPGYEIIEWNEDNIPKDIDYVNWCLRNKHWAFASDYIRFYALDKYGGIYLDTDMEVIRSLERLLDNQLCLGLEIEGRVSNGVIAGVQELEIYRKIINKLETRHSNKQQLIPITVICTETILEHRGSIDIGNNNGINILPKHIFYPYNPYDTENSLNQLMYRDVKEDTLAIHHWNNSWKKSINTRIKQKIRSVFGNIL